MGKLLTRKRFVFIHIIILIRANQILKHGRESFSKVQNMLRLFSKVQIMLRLFSKVYNMWRLLDTVTHETKAV